MPAPKQSLTIGSKGLARISLPPIRSAAQDGASLPSAAPQSSGYRSKPASEVTVLVAGATGYIGKYVVKEMVSRGFKVTALSREQSGIGGKQTRDDVIKEFPSAEVVFGDVTDMSSLTSSVFAKKFDVVVSCLASRTGGKQDSWKIDYQATSNLLQAARKAGSEHFVLLSAICVQRPYLEFQHAKLKFEEELMKAGDISYSIVRPTAYFKSLAAQVSVVQKGAPYVMFGDGHLCSCKPISEDDLAAFMADCVLEGNKVNQVLPIGGPGPAMDAKEQGEMLFRLAGKEPWYFPVPISLMDGIIDLLDFASRVFPSLEDAVEYGKIGKYYATESMLVLDKESMKYDAEATPSYGKTTLEQFFQRVLDEGLAGQELGDQALFK